MIVMQVSSYLRGGTVAHHLFLVIFSRDSLILLWNERRIPQNLFRFVRTLRRHPLLLLTIRHFFIPYHRLLERLLILCKTCLRCSPATMTEETKPEGSPFFFSKSLMAGKGEATTTPPRSKMTPFIVIIRVALVLLICFYEIELI